MEKFKDYNRDTTQDEVMLESWGRKVANRVSNKERKGIRVT